MKWLVNAGANTVKRSQPIRKSARLLLMPDNAASNVMQATRRPAARLTVRMTHPYVSVEDQDGGFVACRRAVVHVENQLLSEMVLVQLIDNSERETLSDTA